MTQKQAKKEYEGKEYINNNGEKLVVVNYINGRLVEVLFVDTNTKRYAEMGDIKKGRVKNPIHGNTSPSHQTRKIGDKFINAEMLEYTLIDRKDRNGLIKFTTTGSTRWLNLNQIEQGLARDLYNPNFYGVGYVGEYNKDVPYLEKAQQLWKNMMSRCYSTTRENNHTYALTEVDTRWLCFEYFLEDIPNLEGFNDWLINDNMELDKDKYGNSQLYSNTTCAFITHTENIQLRY